MTDDTTPTDNVVDLGSFRKKQADYVFTCTCGCQLFYLHQAAVSGTTGDIECRGCGGYMKDRCWGDREMEEKCLT